MNLKFTKMQATGNDYIFANLFDANDFKIFNETNWSQMAIRLSDRHFGIGSDGLILICPSDVADCRMRMFNADGSEGAMCGNGIRCLGKYVYERGLIKKSIICVKTKSGIRTLYLDIEDEMYVKSICVDMGVPVLSSSLEIGSFFVTPVSMGKMAESGEALTADALSAKYLALNKLYFGDTMISDDEIALEWTRIPHFYYNYYVFQYATSFSAAVAIANRILREGESAVKDYKKFLSGGCSKEPVELLRDMGVDMRTSAPVNDALSLFGELIDELSALLG